MKLVPPLEFENSFLSEINPRMDPRYEKFQWSREGGEKSLTYFKSDDIATSRTRGNQSQLLAYVCKRVLDYVGMDIRVI